MGTDKSISELKVKVYPYYSEHILLQIYTHTHTCIRNQHIKVCLGQDILSLCRWYYAKEYVCIRCESVNIPSYTLFLYLSLSLFLCYSVRRIYFKMFPTYYCI